MKYVSGSQVIVNIGLSVSYYANSIAALDVRSSTNIDAYIVSGAINGGNVEKWTSSDLGTTWAKQKLIMNGTNIYPILVYNYNPDAKIVFASWDSTGYHGGIARGYLYGNKGFVINTGIAVPTTTASMKGGCDGILVNAPAQVTGKYGLGYQFVAATKHNIRIPDNDLLSFAGSTPFSITAWINVTTVTGAHYIVSKSELDTLNEYAIDIYNSNIYFVVQSPVNFANYIRSFTPFTTLNTWVFICATCDGSGTKEGLQMCINAAEPAHTHDSGGTYTGMTNGTGPLSIGGQGRTTGDGTYFTDGLIDEVKIWNKVLSLAEQANVRDNIEW
jgi:hypothetical protein